MSRRKTVHVTYRKDDNSWHVLKSNANSSKSYNSQNEAVKNARKMAMESGLDLVIHGEDGKIQTAARSNKKGTCQFPISLLMKWS